MSWPSSFTVPRSTPSNPATMRNKVVLPQPEGPSRETNSPWPTPRSTPSSTVAAPKDLVAPETSRKARSATTGLEGHLAIPALDPAVAFLGDELPVEIVHLDVAADAERRLGGSVGREGEGLGLKLVLQFGAQQHVDQRQRHFLVGAALHEADAGGTDEDAFLRHAHLDCTFLFLGYDDRGEQARHR